MPSTVLVCCLSGEAFPWPCAVTIRECSEDVSAGLTSRHFYVVFIWMQPAIYAKALPATFMLSQIWKLDFEMPQPHPLVHLRPPHKHHRGMVLSYENLQNQCLGIKGWALSYRVWGTRPNGFHASFLDEWEVSADSWSCFTLPKWLLFPPWGHISNYHFLSG